MRCNTVNLVCEEDLGCAEDADCSSGEVCNKGSESCVPRCTTETESTVCAGGEHCFNSICVQCETNSDCGVGLICDAAGKCGAQPRCYQDRDCNVPLVCYVPTGECVDKPPPCVSDESCPSDQRCEIGTGRCVPRACQPDIFEPDNDLTHARPMTPGKYINLTLCPGDVDYYSFTLSRGDQLGINVDADPFSEDHFSTVVQDATGRTLAFGHLLTSYVAAAADTYYVGISTIDSYQPYDVVFLLTRGTPCDNDSWESNDTPQSATPLNSAGQVDGTICPQDLDNFSVPVPAGKGVKASLVNYNSVNGLLQICLFDGLTQVACSDDPGTPAVTAPAAVAGGKTMRVLVNAVDPRSANSYTLKVEFQ
jgi:Cys-rich repeat protein